MKIGDKVRFLDTVGGGIVRGFQGKDIVLVEDEDGFEIPILTRECVVIEPANESQVRQSSKPNTDIQRQAVQEEPEEIYEIIETKEGEKISVHLAYLANDLKNLSNSDFECYLVNDSNYYLSFNYISKTENGWICRHTGIIEPNTKLYIEGFTKQDLNEIERVCLQYFAYKKDKPFDLKDVSSTELRIDTVKFYKLHSFRENDFFDEEAIIYTIVQKDSKKEEISISPREIEQAMKSKDSNQPRRQRIERKEKQSTVEVDLHAHELLETTAGLSNSDILEFQLKEFREVMDANKNKKGQKIVFIHGKGEGILRNALLKELKVHYKTATFQDASFQEYGFGATMITIR